jgi:hypothetical protein
MLRYVSIRTSRRRKDAGIHAFCAQIARLLVVVVVVIEILLPPTDDTESA